MIHEMSVDQNLVIVDKDLWDTIKNQSELNKKSIEDIATQKFMEYVKNTPMEFLISIRDNYTMLRTAELCIEENWDERGYKDPINTRLMQDISDQIVNAVNSKYEERIKVAKQEVINRVNRQTNSIKMQNVALKWTAVVLSIYSIFATIAYFAF